MKRLIVGVIVGALIGSCAGASGYVSDHLRAYNVDCQAWAPDKAIFCATTTGKGAAVRFTSHDVLVYNARTQIPIFSIAHIDPRTR